MPRAAVHAHGVVHGDLRAGPVFLTVARLRPAGVVSPGCAAGLTALLAEVPVRS